MILYINQLRANHESLKIQGLCYFDHALVRVAIGVVLVGFAFSASANEHRYCTT